MAYSADHAWASLEGSEAVRDTQSSFWHLGPPEVDYSDPENPVVVRGGMTEGQRRWWELTTFVKLLMGGYGSGKTLPFGKRAIASALQNAPCPVACVSPTFPMARTTTVATIKALLSGKQSILGRRNFVWKYNVTTHEFSIRYRGRDATIIIYSGEDPDALKGPNLAAAYMDEPFLMEKAVFDQMLYRVRHPDAKLLEMALTGTPEGLGWGYELVEGEDAEKLDVGLVRLSTLDNPVLPPEYKRRLLASMSELEQRAYVKGEFVDLTQGLVFHSFDRRANVGEFDRPKNARLGVGMDFNVNPFCHVVFWYTDDRIHFFAEEERADADTDLVCGDLHSRYWDKGLRDIFPDASGVQRRTSAPGGKTDFYYIRRHGFNIQAPPKNAGVRDTFLSANGAMRRVAADGQRCLTVSPKCRRLVKYLTQYSYAKMTTNEQKAFRHLIDAFRYPVDRLFPVRKETPEVSKIQGA